MPLQAYLVGPGPWRVASGGARRGASGGTSRLRAPMPARGGRSRRPVLAPAAQTENGALAAGATPPSPSPSLSSVTISVTKRVSFGQALKLVGAHPDLGAWDVGAAPAATWGPGDVWRLEISHEACAGPAKLVVVEGEGGGASAEWEAGPDRELDGLGAGAVTLEWGVAGSGQAAAPAARPSSPPSTPAPTSTEWVGPPPVFLQANTHRSDRAGLGLAWDTTALPPAGPAAALVAGDADAPSWLDKMRLVAAVVADGDRRPAGGPGPDPATPPGARRPDLDALANAYIYLTLIARGVLPCVEAGGHARPNRAAEAGLKTFRSLEWAAGDTARCDATTRAMALRLHARLPSFDGAFTQATPLTRVRDLAHRNDIAQALKREIKHTIQNKLHRCAGPEDLVATEALLARLYASKGKGGDDDVPNSFLAEFETFTGELRAFFNASDLEASLGALGASLDDAGHAAVARLLASKAAADSLTGEDPLTLASRAGEEVRVGEGGAGGGLATSPLDAALNAAAEALHAATTLRATLARGLGSGLRTDAPDTSLAMRQAWRIADARAEEYVFVTLSWALNLCEASGFGLAPGNGKNDDGAPPLRRGSPALARAPDDRWALPLGLVLLGVRNVGLSGWAPPAECLAVENELAAWAAGGGLGGRGGSRPAALRLKASLERALRLAGTVCDGLTGALADRADALGAALGVPDRTAGFAEAEVRASVAFQLAKAAAFVQRAARGAAALAGGGSGEPDSPWSALVPGEAVGTLLSVADLDDAPAAAAACGAPSIILARRASGEEEVGRAAGPGGSLIRGILLLQDLPHLSHLGVRARQEGLPFAACAGLGVGVEGGDEEEDGVDRALVGEAVRVTISPDGAVAVGPAGGAGAPTAAAIATTKKTPAAAAAAPSFDVDMRASAPVPLAAAAPETCGPKAAACGALLRAAGAAGSLFTAPPGFVLPFGALPAAAVAAGVGRDLAAALEAVEVAAGEVMLGGGGGGSEAALASLDAAAAAARALVASLRPDPTTLAAAVQAHFPAGVDAVAVRSSSAAEDLAGAAAAGLFASVLGVPLPKAAAAAAAPPAGAWDPLATAIGEVWASLFSRRAVLARASAGVGQGGAAMAVLIQAQAPAALSFILHTADPSAPAGVPPASLLAAEVAVGAGEALASGGVAGSPWRLVVEKEGSGGAATVRAFANLSSALLPVPAGAGTTMTPTSTLAWRPVDYSRHPLSCDGEALQALGSALAAAGCALEAAAGGVPQDVEGCFGPGALAALAGQGIGKGAQLVPVIVQTRPQPGV